MNYALTTARAQRLKILLVLLASGHGFGRRARHAAELPRRALTRGRGRGGREPQEDGAPVRSNPSRS